MAGRLSTLPSRHNYKDEILRYQRIMGFDDSIANEISSMTAKLDNVEFYKYIDDSLKKKNGGVSDYFFDKSYVTVVTSAIYSIISKIDESLEEEFKMETFGQKHLTVKYFLDNIIYVGNTNRSRYAKLLASVGLRNKNYLFTHFEKQGDPCPKVHMYKKKEMEKRKTCKLFEWFKGGR